MPGFDSPVGTKDNFVPIIVNIYIYCQTLKLKVMKKNEISVAEALAALKKAGKFSEEELKDLGSFAKEKEDVLKKAKKDAERKAREAEKEAVYKKEKQTHRLEVNEKVTELADLLLKKATNKTAEHQWQDANEVKKAVQDFFKNTMPKPPKKGRLSNGGTTNGGSDYKRVSNIAEDSANWHIVKIMNEAGSIKRDELTKKLVAALPDRKEAVLKLQLSKAVNGQLPIGKNDNDELYLTEEVSLES